MTLFTSEMMEGPLRQTPPELSDRELTWTSSKLISSRFFVSALALFPG